MSQYTYLDNDGHPSRSMAGHQHQRRSLDSAQIRSITNEKFLHIMYYPIIGGPLSKTKAILEVCYNTQSSVPKNILSNQIQNYLETFNQQLNSLESRIRTFCKFTEGAIMKRDGIKKTKYFQRWKTNIQFENQKQHFVLN